MGSLARKQVPINIPQAQFLQMTNKFRGFVGGYGSSKTYSGCLGMCQHYYKWPGVNQGYFAPTYPHIRDIFYETIEEVAFSMNLRLRIKVSDKEVHFYEGRSYRGMTICRSMNKPEDIIGFKIGHALIDELDLLPLDKAQVAWRKIIARMRYNVPGLINGIDVTTTPEGFKFVHKLFVAEPAKNPALRHNYGLVQASTYDNAINLPDDYIPSLIETYPEELIQAYLHGQFVNLTSGTVYHKYNRIAHNSKEQIEHREPLFIGMDFNVQHMAASIFVQRANGFHAVAELKDIFDTPAMIEIIKEKYPRHRIVVYPDSSGKSRKSVDASKTDISLLSQANFELRYKSDNPRVKDRVLATNKAFEDGWLHINERNCPTIAKCLEQQCYDTNGEPDKSTGTDHQNDATTYPVIYERPVRRIHVVGNQQLEGYY